MDNLIEFSSGPSSDEDGVLAKHTEMPIKRMAIIDTCNILHECAGCASNLTNPDPSERPKPDALGILALAKVFLEEGYDIKMFVPVSYMNPNKVVNVFILEQFHHLGYLTIIDDGSHDDLLILEMAKNVGGFVVSNDKFRDHLAKVESLMNVIKARTVFCRAKRIPIYDVGKEFIRTAGNKCYIGFRLNFTPNKKAMYAENDDPSFAMAFAQRKNRLQSKVRHALEVIGVMYDYFQHMNCLANNVRPPILEYFDPAQEEFPKDDFAIFLDRLRIAQNSDLLMKSYKLRRSYTLLTVMFLALAYIANHLALAWVHDRVPKTSPLPDLLFSWTKEIPSAIFLAEYIMIFLLANGLIVIFFHQHKWIVVRRVFFCAGICYFTRAMAITLIQLPVPSRYTYCAPQTNGSLEIIVSRVVRICWSAGIEQLRSRVLCGDLIVSGHTISIFLSLLALQEYSPRKISALSYLYSVLAYIALCCILLARKHYTIDVVLGYFLATRTFWTYHSLQYSFHLGQLDKNPMNNVIWAWVIPFLESDAPSPGIFSNVLVWPSSCPSRFRRDSMHQVNA